jgi:hypothetical protein
MATQWIALAKIVGPIVKEIRQEFVDWTCSRPADGEEPNLTSKDGWFVVKEEDAKARMQVLGDLLESHAHRPPVIYYEKLLDPWTAGPLFVLYTMLRNRNLNLRVARGDVLDYLLIQPDRWDDFKEAILNITQARSFHDTEIELERLISHLLQCGLAWERLLSGDRAIIVSFRSMDTGWLDAEVSASQLALPSWYESKSVVEAKKGKTEDGESSL